MQTRWLPHICITDASNTLISLVTPLLTGKCKHRLALAWLFPSKIRQLKTDSSAFCFRCHEKSSQDCRISSFSRPTGNRSKYNLSLYNADSLLPHGGFPSIIHSLKELDSLSVAGNVSVNPCKISLLGADPSLDGGLDLTRVAKVSFSCMHMPDVFPPPFP